jgi:hypothetical protein
LEHLENKEYGMALNEVEYGSFEAALERSGKLEAELKANPELGVPWDEARRGILERTLRR